MIDMSNSRYKLARGSQVREEDFGLLFYRMNGPRLYFISSGDFLSPDFFKGEVSLKEWLDKGSRNNIDDAGISGLIKILDQLKEKGVIIEC